MSNQKQFAGSKVTMDARKFLSTINQGFAGQAKLLEHKLQKLGTELGRNFSLVAAHPTFIYFSDAKSNQYYKADYKKTDGVVTLENIQHVEIEDRKKRETFAEACEELIESIESDDSAKQEKAFSKLEFGHCTPKVIPESGYVRARDGRSYRIHVKGSYIPEQVFPLLGNVIKEAVKGSKLTISEGTVKFADQSVKLPITELTRRQSIARQMRVAAESAYTSQNFVKLIKSTAGHISNGQITEAIALCKNFFAEQQEFTLLNKAEFTTLIENAMYSVGVFSYQLNRDAAELLWETNCHVNKATILKEWRTTAEKTKVKAFIGNVKILEDAAAKHPRIFSDTYNTFLIKTLSEDQSSKAVKSQAYLNMLKLLKNVVTGSDADMAVQSTVDDLIMRLEADINNIDDALLYEIEDLLATTSSDLVNDVSSLGDFDKVPEPIGVTTFGDDMVGEFDGDMGDAGGAGGGMGAVGGGAPDMGGGAGGPGDAIPAAGADAAGAGAPGAAGSPLPGGDASGDVAAGTEPAGSTVPAPGEEEEDLLDLAHVIRTAKPIAEMTAADVTGVVECLKGMEPEALEEGQKEFKSLRKKDLSESETKFVKSVIERAKAINDNLFSQITEAYFNVVVGSMPISESDISSPDVYKFDGKEVAINADYKGASVSEEWEKPWEKKDKKEEGDKAEKSDKKEEPKGDKSEKKVDDKSADKKDGAADEKKDDKPDFLKKEDKETPKAKEDDKKDDEKKVEESVAIVAVDDDAKLMSLIQAVMAGDKGDVGDDGLEDAEKLLNEPAIEEPAAEPVLDAPPADELGDELANPEESDVPPVDPAIANDTLPPIADEDVSRLAAAISEDNDIGEPTEKKHSSETAADKDGDGTKRNNEITFSDIDFDGSHGAKTGKSKPNAGLSGATKE